MVDHTVSRKIRSRFSGLLDEQTRVGRQKGGSLFERLMVEEDQSGMTVREGMPGYMDSIKRNLQKILNSRLGHSPSAPQLGLGDFNDGSIESTDMAKQIQKDIQHTIQNYEPRISSVEVEYDHINSSALDIHFSISAKVPVGNGSERILVDIILENGNHCRVI